MTLNLQEVARAIGAKVEPEPRSVSGWSVDTRTQNAGDVYFALRGPNHDGHSFLPVAIEKGAAAVVVDHGAGMPHELVVNDTELALQDLGARARTNWGGCVIG